MRQTYRILPTYTSDVSGVCSALYELGGLVVIHDPSGCNSTYNTHDEIRWYDHDSLIFISALTERDAMMGNDEKFYRDVLDAAEEFKPEFIALTNSPIPWLTGTDFPAIVKKLEKSSGIPAFYVPANGMHDYTAGAGKAFVRVAERLVDEHYSKKIPDSINIIGVTPLDYAGKNASSEIRTVFEDAGFNVVSTWAMDDSLENIRRSGEAGVNLVVSAAGLYAAKKLEQKFGTPYVIGTPVGPFTDRLTEALKNARQENKNINAYTGVLKDASNGALYPENADFDITLTGDPVVMGSLAAALRISRGLRTRVLCPAEIHAGLLCENDIKIHGEEDAETLLKNAAAVIADPLYRLICPDNIKFYPLPHLALSGRIYLNEMMNLTDLEV